MHHAPAVRHTRHSSCRHTATIIRDRPGAVNATSVLYALVLPARHAAEPLGVTVGSTLAWSAQNNPVWVAWPRTQRPLVQAHYNSASTRAGTLCKAALRPVVSFP